MPGADEFEANLTALGLSIRRHGQLVVVELEAELGPFAGTTLEVGTDPPKDFPRVPPHWLHLPAHIELPGGKRNASELGSDWSKWSRKHPCWRPDGNPTHQWLAHVRSLIAKATRP